MSLFKSNYKSCVFCGVYQIKNKLNNKVYIGSSKGIECRFYEHRKKLRKNNHDNAYLQNSWNKYGENNFEFKIILECKEEELIQKEQIIINELKSFERENGYNICEVANKPWMTEDIRNKISNTLAGRTPWNVGKSHSEEAKEKMRGKRPSISGANHPCYGKEISNETKEKIRIGNIDWNKTNTSNRKGMKHSNETKEKIRQSHLGKTLSDETKMKISESNKGKTMSPITKEKFEIIRKSKMRKIGQYKDEILIAEFESIADAKRKTGIYTLDKCIYNGRKQAGGYNWRPL